MKKYMFLLIFVFCSGALHAAGQRDLLLKGVKDYKKGKYGAALDSFDKAAQADADSEKPLYNSAAAQYKLKDYAKSAELYQQSADKKTEFEQNSYFNKGNALYRKGDRDAAKEAYKTAILLNPKDKSAIHNLQILLQEQKQNQDSENKKQDEDDNKKDNQQGDGDQQEQNAENSQMDQQDAMRLIQMMREQEEKGRNHQARQYNGQDGSSQNPEKDW